MLLEEVKNVAKDVDLLTLKEVADKLKVTKRTAWRYYKKGDLKGIKLDGGIRIPDENLQKFIEERYN